MERVKRLAGNDIELGIEIPTIESRASNIPMTKGTTCYAVRPIKIFVKYVGANMGIQVPLLVIDRRGILVSYIVHKPVGSACLTFVDDIVLYELCMLVTECCLEFRIRSGHDEELRNGPEMKIDIWDNGVWSLEGFRNSPEGVPDVSRNVCIREHFIWAKRESPQGFRKAQKEVLRSPGARRPGP